MKTLRLGDSVNYMGRQWEITAICGSFLGLVDLDGGERLTVSFAKLAQPDLGETNEAGVGRVRSRPSNAATAESGRAIVQRSAGRG
ncbi:hypothetical protein AB4Z38_08905 [Arthrobacter sp. 2RAF6]|uniref:hypothetical protein n=1 Tax=Arthrobacter sp. 2RAF6 TaxID=3233002 RepID=UPI003F93F53F